MNSFARDAQGAGRFTLDLLENRKKRLPDVTDEEFFTLIRWLATWAAHWARKVK